MLPTECYSSLVGYNTNGATLTNLSVYGPEYLSGFQMLAYMLSPSGLICCGGGSDGESGLDLLRDEGGKSDESSGYRTRYENSGTSVLWEVDGSNKGGDATAALIRIPAAL
ncbi:hypothetical protein Tco_1449623 [Tanacetum coccineum]